MVTLRARKRLMVGGLFVGMAGCLAILLFVPWTCRQISPTESQTDLPSALGVCAVVSAMVVAIIMVARIISPPAKAADMRARVAGLRKTLEDAATAVNTESAAIESKLNQLALEFDTVESQLGHQRRELEHYKQLAELTKEQQAAFLKQLARNRPRDIVFGIILGIVSSLLASVVWTSLHLH